MYASFHALMFLNALINWNGIIIVFTPCWSSYTDNVHVFITMPMSRFIAEYYAMQLYLLCTLFIMSINSNYVFRSA